MNKEEVIQLDYDTMDKIRNYNEKLILFFLKTKKLEGCTTKTLKCYQDMLMIWNRELTKKFTELNAMEIRNYLMSYQDNRGISNHSLDNIRRIFSTFFNYLEEEDYVTKNPIRKIHKIKGEQIIHSPFTDEEIELLRDNCPSIRELALIDFLNSSGVRVSELCNMDITDIDLNRREGIVLGKGAKERIIYIDARTKVHMSKYLETRNDNNSALFVTANEPHERLSKSGVEFIVRTIGEMSNIEKCHPHRFRRSLATRLIDRNVPIEQVQKILGHAKIETTLIYAQVNQQNVKINHAKFAA